MAFNLRFADRSGLCGTCQHALITVYENGTKDIFCGSYQRSDETNARVLQPVVKCSAYADKSRPSINQYEKLAWVIVTDKTKKIGFKPYRDLTKEERREIKYDNDPFETED